MSLVLLLFFLTYYHEFRRVRVSFKCIREDLDRDELLFLRP